MDPVTANDLPIEQLQLEFVNSFRETDPVQSLHNLINTLPYAAAILTPNRRAIFTNLTLLSKYGYASVEQALGKRPGEMLNCLHSHNNNNQCGVSQHCKVCGAMVAMNNTLVSQKASIAEMHLTAVLDGSNVSHDLLVTVSPLLVKDKVYMIMYINDISHEKRRKAIERIFFHDVLNKVSSLNGLYELISKESDYSIQREYLDLIGLIISDMTDEIVSQRQLAAAESGDIAVNWEELLLVKIIDRIILQVSQFSNPKDIKIKYEQNDKGISLISDKTLLNRVITNVLKNAIEASEYHQLIIVKATKIENYLEISVTNQIFIPQEIQLQIFQRSFSTKGENRGLGTYSIKLITERYLGGEVWFNSNPDEGTTFTIKLPLVPLINAD